MNLPKRELYKLTVKQMRPDELRNRIKEKQRFIKSMRKYEKWSLKAINEAKKELKSRPRTKRYEPGIYWSHTAYLSQGEWTSGNEELVIVDHDGQPWMWGELSGKWLSFGKPMNSTKERSWERVSDL